MIRRQPRSTQSRSSAASDVYKRQVAGVAVVPLQTGINNIGGWITDKEELLKTVKELKSSNSKLKKQVDELTQENSLLAQNKYELTRLRELLKLDEDYSQYEKVAANVIGKDTGNLFDIFIINLSLIHISEPTRLGMISYAVFCLKKKK